MEWGGKDDEVGVELESVSGVSVLGFVEIALTPTQRTFISTMMAVNTAGPSSPSSSCPFFPSARDSCGGFASTSSTSIRSTRKCMAMPLRSGDIAGGTGAGLLLPPLGEGCGGGDGPLEEDDDGEARLSVKRFMAACVRFCKSPSMRPLMARSNDART